MSLAAGDLAGAVLLLSVGDRAGWRTHGPVGPVLSGAVLCQQVLDGRPVRLLAPDRFALVRLVVHQAPAAEQELTAALCRAGVLTPAEHRVLGVFPRRGFAVVDATTQQAAAAGLRAALRPGSRVEAGPAALAVLCAVSGTARAWSPAPTRRRDRRALAEHLNGLRAVVGPDVAEVLIAVRDAYGRSTSRSADGSDGFVSDRGDGYGDDGGGGDGGGDGGGGGGD